MKLRLRIARLVAPLPKPEIHEVEMLKPPAVHQVETRVVTP